MRENEFEKEVQQKMEGFHLSPSAEVWVEVERRIRKEKKRRFIFWWFFGLAGIGGGLALLLFTGKKQSPSVMTDNNKNDKQVIPLQPVATKKLTAPSTFDLNSISDTANKNKSNNNTISAITPKANTIATAPVIKRTTKQERSTSARVEKKNTVSNSPNEVDMVALTDTNARKPAPVQPATDIPVIAVQNAKQDTIPTAIAIVEKPAQPKMDSVAVAPPVAKNENHSKKWVPVVHGSFGRSAVVDGLSFSNAPLYANALGTGGSPVGTPGPDNLPGLNTSLAWSAGVFVKRTISKKLELRIGLDYRYLSTKMEVGMRVSSQRYINNENTPGLVINNYYRTPSAAEHSSYTNKYHFLDLSAGISWKIIRTKRSWLSWDNGLSYGRLLNSSMLLYDPALPGYYKDKGALTKNHLFLSTGFSVPVSGRWQVNPFASYSLTPVLQRTGTLSTHFMQYGIRLQFLLNKK